jgi:regulatory protein
MLEVMESHPVPGPARPPDRAALREAALAHLARFATTRHGLEQVLLRRITRWAQRGMAAGAAAEDVEGHVRALRPLVQDIVAEMERLGAVDDAAFADARARALTRAGRSARAIVAHLAQRGVDGDAREQALAGRLGDGAGEDAELAAALVLARRRRIGPFAPDAPDEAARHKALMVMARAGFGGDVARQALAMDPQEAEGRVVRMKSL